MLWRKTAEEGKQGMRMLCSQVREGLPDRVTMADTRRNWGSKPDGCAEEHLTPPIPAGAMGTLQLNWAELKTVGHCERREGQYPDFGFSFDMRTFGRAKQRSGKDSLGRERRKQEEQTEATRITQVRNGEREDDGASTDHSHIFENKTAVSSGGTGVGCESKGEDKGILRCLS